MMDPTSQTIDNPSNWLDGKLIPNEIKMMILEHTSSHDDLLSLIEAYPEWVLELWERYPVQLFPRAWNNVLKDIDPVVIPEAIFVFHIRKIREDYTIFMGSSHETQQHREMLENTLRAFLSRSQGPKPWPELEASLDTIHDLAEVIRDVNSLTRRYSNDAWKRIRDIAEMTGTGPVSSTDGPSDPPEIRLTEFERYKFNRAFLRVEIYLLTKYWTNAAGERHILDMGADIEPFIPHSNDRDGERQQFDSCLRYIFNAYRRHLKKTAREQGAPELPTRDDLPWVRNWNEDYEYQHEDYPTLIPGDPAISFAQRSVSEEQAFLLWLCEFGIGPLERAHQAECDDLRDELLLQFGRRQAWGTVRLRHRFSRYDDCVEDQLSSLQSASRSDRNRHPVASLYGDGAHQRCSDVSSPWACASAFLSWSFNGPVSGHFRSRGGVTLNEHGRWVTMSDTDRGASNWNPFRRRDRVHGDVPYGHPYMMNHEKYEIRPIPRRIWIINP